MIDISDKVCRENQNIDFMFKNVFFFENRAVYDIMWKKNDTAKQATDDNIIRRTRFACWIPKTTDTLRIFNTYCFCRGTIVSRNGHNVIFILILPVLFVGVLMFSGHMCRGDLCVRL
jgi:hypothetical protein